MKILFDHIKTESFDIEKNGIQIVERDNCFEIYNDPFRTVPLFITKNESGQLIIFSDFGDFYNFDNVNRDVDLTGFWEIVLFGSGLWTRTLYKNVQQMPGATRIVIQKLTNEYKIERYWDYNVEVNEGIDTIQKATDGLYDRLDAIFARLDKNKKYLMGMSGGMDSRITLAFLSKHIPKENVTLFTYGFDEGILEYRYAKEISETLGFEIPRFHQLTIDSYRNAAKYLPKMSGGQIAITHCHILDYLKGGDWKLFTQLSTYYSDAIFGWDCISPKYIGDLNDNYYIKTIKKCGHLPERIKNDVITDSLNIFAGHEASSNHSSLNEYKYVTERNQKFHMYLASIQGSLIATDLVYADIGLLKYLLSIPIEYRAQKKMIDCLLEKYFKNISSRDFKNISSRFQWGSQFSGFMAWYWFKLLNRVNAALLIFTNGKLQLLNKYQTEEQERLLYSEFSSDLYSATTRFVELNIMTTEQKKYWDKLPLGSAGVAERYALISLAKVLCAESQNTFLSLNQ
jgi:hypothetical protein